MKFSEKIIPFLWLFIVSFSCVAVEKTDKTGFIDLKKAIASPVKVNLGKVAVSLQYVPLETSDSCLLPGYNHFYVEENYIVAVPEGNVPVLFDRNGRYLNKIGMRGKGPGELVGIVQHVYLDSRNRQVTLYMPRKTMFFGIDGKFRRAYSVNLDSLYKTRTVSGTFPKIEMGGTGSRMLVFDLHPDSSRVYTAEPSVPGDMKRLPGLYGVWSFSRPSTDPRAGHSPWKTTVLYKPVIHYGNDYATYYDGQYCRYYRFYYDGRVEQVYDLRVPASPTGSYGIVESIVETGRYLFLYLLAEGNGYYCLYDKQEDKLFCLDSPMGMKNDLDSGIPFWPDGVTPDGKLYMYRDALRFKKQAAESKNTELRAFAEKIEDDDNPVLIFATLR